MYGKRYLDIITHLGVIRFDKNIGVTSHIVHEDYPNGYALYAFDLSPDLAEEGHFNLARQFNIQK